MTENSRKFLEALSEHTELREKANRAETKEELIEMAQSLGVTLTEADFVKEDGEELSEKELAAVSGGEDSCLGTGDMLEDGCACVLFGVAKGAICFLLGAKGI